MSRSGYGDDCDGNWSFIKWRGQVASAIRGKRGQAFLRELIAAMDAMPEKRLIANDLRRLSITRRSSEVCALGAVGNARCLPLERLDPENYDAIAAAFGIAHQLVQEIEWENDEGGYCDTPETRWQRMRDWAERCLRGTGEAVDAS